MVPTSTENPLDTSSGSNLDAGRADTAFPAAAVDPRAAVFDLDADTTAASHAAELGAPREFGHVPEGYVEPVDVAFLNRWRRLIGAYPPSLGATRFRRTLPYVTATLALLGVSSMLYMGMNEFVDYNGRLGQHAERTPVLVVGDPISDDEPPLRVEMALDRECKLCGNSIDVAVQHPSEAENAPKGRNFESGECRSGQQRQAHDPFVSLQCILYGYDVEQMLCEQTSQNMLMASCRPAVRLERPLHRGGPG
jgi:hypothetical protein